jgi:peptide/nickel transport system substrate-binding protein
MMASSRRQLLTGLAGGAALLGGASPPARAQQPSTLRIRFYDDPAGFDPANIFRIENENIAFNIFSGLTTYDSTTGAIIPDLAEAWENTANTVFTFRLRRGVKWQKGYGEFTSADVVYSYNRIIDPRTSSPYAAEFANVERVEAPDPYTVIFRLKAPDGNFLHQVANYHQGQIVNQKAIADAGDRVRWSPVGTGPYLLDSIDVTSRIVLKRHAEYFRGPAPIDTLHFQIIKDEATSTIALRNGEIDLIMRSNRQENIETLARAGFRLNRVDNYAALVRVTNAQSNRALGDVRVRQALAHAIDWEAVCKATGSMLTAPGHSLLLPWMDGYTADVPRYPFDQARARRLLQEAGVRNLTVRQLGTAAQGVTEIQQFEIDFLSQVGVTMRMELVDTPTFNQRRNRAEFELSSRLLPAVNPDTILFSYLHPANAAPRGLNGARFDNPRVTAALEAARAEVDPVKRQAFYAEVQRIAMTDLSYTPLYTSNVIWPGKQNVAGVRINYLAQVNFHDVRFV